MTNKTVYLITFNIIILIFIGLLPYLLKNWNRQDQKKNLIIISVDALRPDYISLYNHQKKTTPKLNKWFNNSILFENAYTTTPKTYSSFTTLFTGISPARHKVFDYLGYDIDDKIQWLPDILKKNGYYSSAFVSSWILDHYKNGKDSQIKKKFNEWHYLPYNEPGLFISHTEYETFFSQINQWLEKNKNKQFFLWIHLFDPHDPYYPPPEYQCKFNIDLCPLIKNNSREELVKNTKDNRGSYLGCSIKKVDEDIIKINQTLYEGEIGYTDFLINNIMSGVKKQGLDKNSITILYSDHGEGFDHDYYFNHGVLYDSNTKIVLAIKDPSYQFKTTRQIKQLIDNTDIMPTLLDLLGISLENKQFDGNSYINIINKESNTHNKTVYGYNHFLNYFSIRQGDFKYIYSLMPNCLYSKKTEELYNVKLDPNELLNIVSTKPLLAKKLKNKLLKHLSKNNLVTD